MTDPRPHGDDSEQESRDELVAEADQFLNLSGADPETPVQAGSEQGQDQP